MANNKFDINNIPAEKFVFVNENRKLSDKKFDDKPISYFKDAWIRFRKNKASVAATVIIVIIILFAFLAPLFNFNYDQTFMDPFYAKKGPRSPFLMQIGLADGTVSRDFSEKGIVKALATGVGALNVDGTPVSIGEAMDSYYQPIKSMKEPTVTLNAKKEEVYSYNAKIDTYLEFGFIYRSVEQSTYQQILEFEKETGLKVLYPLIADNEYNFDVNDANYWYKTKKANPVKTVDVNGQTKTKTLSYAELGNDLVLEDNYKRDADGNVMYYEYTGGGNFETAQYKVRVLYYNYYQFVNGFEPNYLMGTDSQGYDLMLRMAGGIQLSLLVAVLVSLLNFIIGAFFGAISGYYGGTLDILLQRLFDILGGVPFVVVATLFQIHLAAKVGPIPSLLFAFVLTGWLGIAGRVRTQFYRFKGQEFVMAARTLGANDNRLIWKHIFPNSLGTLITSCALIIPGVINSESMLSFLGIVKLGTAKTTSLGTLLADASSIWTNYPHLMIFPAIILSLLMICFNLFGNGLRDAFNPSLRGVEE